MKISELSFIHLNEEQVVLTLIIKLAFMFKKVPADGEAHSYAHFLFK